MKNKKLLKEIISYILIILAVLLFRIFLYSPIVVRESSMVPTLHDGEVMILNKIGYKINGLKRFDIIVLRRDGEKLIKRVIGLPGEDIEYIDNVLYVNGKKVDENYTRKETEDFILEVVGYSKIPEDKYLVMGDNRPFSLDSRTFGLIDKKDIVGYTDTIIFPFKYIKKVK
jgi:signal peptidase I